MQLSWLSTSEAHKHTSMYMIWQSKAMHKAKRERERVRVNGSNANTKICFEVRAPSSTSPPSLRRIFTIASTHDFPYREPPLRIWVIQTRSTQLLSQPIQPLTRGKAQHKSRLHLDGWALRQTTINLSLEGLGSKPTPTTITSHLRDSNSISTITYH